MIAQGKALTPKCLCRRGGAGLRASCAGSLANKYPVLPPSPPRGRRLVWTEGCC